MKKKNNTSNCQNKKIYVKLEKNYFELRVYLTSNTFLIKMTKST